MLNNISLKFIDYNIRLYDVNIYVRNLKKDFSQANCAGKKFFVDLMRNYCIMGSHF